MVLLLCRSADGVSFDSVKNALRVPVLSLRYERYSHCAPRGIVSALQRYSASDIISIEEELVSEIANHKWCFVLDNMNALRLHYISPMLYVVPAIINGISVIEQHYKKKIDFRIILVQSSNSPYNQPDGKYEKLFMPLGTTLNAKKFVDEYLSSYSKRLSKEQIERLHNCSLTVHPRSIFMVCEYLRLFGKHEQLTNIIRKLDTLQRTTDTYQLFIDDMRQSFDETQIRKIVAYISLFSYGLSKKHLEDLSGMSNIDFHRAWRYLSILTKEEQDGAIHWENDSIARFIDYSFNLDKTELRITIGKECADYFNNIVNNINTAKMSLMAHNTARKVWKYMDHSNMQFIDFFENFKRMYHIPKPTKVECLCYLESLCIAKRWEQLEKELTNREVLNYVWHTSVLIDCWIVGMKEGNISFIQPNLKNYDKMLHVAYALRNAEGIQFYSEAQKKSNKQ